MGIIARVLGWAWRRWADYNSFIALLDLLDWKTGLTAAIGGVVMGVIASTNMDWSPQAVILGVLVSAACVTIIVIAVRLLLTHRKLSPKTPPTATELPPSAVTAPQSPATPAPFSPNIDAREAFSQILEKSEWREQQLRTTTDTKHLVYDWLERRLDNEIHKALRNSLLASWGEECLQGTVTTPDKPIPPEVWDRVEIVFDRQRQFPRTAAHWKGHTSREVGRMAWVAVRFSKDQIFQLFPINDNTTSNKISFNAHALPPAQYSKAQINKIVEAIDTFFPQVLGIERALIYGKGIAESLEAIIRSDGALVFVKGMDELRLKLIDPSDALDKSIEDYGLYTEVCRMVSDKKNFHDPLFASYNELAGILREIPDHLSAPALTNYVEAKKATFVTRVIEYLDWAKRKKKTLTECREWFLRLKTTN